MLERKHTLVKHELSSAESRGMRGPAALRRLQQPRGCDVARGMRTPGGAGRVMDPRCKTCREQGWESGLAGNQNWGSRPAPSSSQPSPAKRLRLLKACFVPRKNRCEARSPRPWHSGRGTASKAFVLWPERSVSRPLVPPSPQSVRTAGKAQSRARCDGKGARQETPPTAGPVLWDLLPGALLG